MIKRWTRISRRSIRSFAAFNLRLLSVLAGPSVSASLSEDGSPDGLGDPRAAWFFVLFSLIVSGGRPDAFVARSAKLRRKRVAYGRRSLVPVRVVLKHELARGSRYALRLR